MYLTNQFWIFQDPVPDFVWNIGLGGIDQVLARLDTTPNNLDTTHLIKAGMLYNTKSQCVFIDCIVVQLFVDRLCALYKNQHKSFDSSFQ